MWLSIARDHYYILKKELKEKDKVGDLSTERKKKTENRKNKTFFLSSWDVESESQLAENSILVCFKGINDGRVL